MKKKKKVLQKIWDFLTGIFQHCFKPLPCSPHVLTQAAPLLSNFEDPNNEGVQPPPMFSIPVGNPASFWSIETTVQFISTKMYYVLSTKILQGSDTGSGTVLRKTCSNLWFKS